LLEMAILTSYFLWASDIYRMTVAAEDFDNGIVQSLGDGRVAFVGSIGPTLMRDLATVETQNGSFRVLEITSDGGLMDQALLLAQEVETRRISVVVRARCLSACVAVAVASPESYAESGAIFGFHRTALVADAVSEITQIEGQQFNQLYFDFLRQHGVPEAILQQGIERGADEIYEVPAAEMVDAGAIKGLISGERVIRIGPKM
jgi:hypothetical protein